MSAEEYHGYSPDGTMSQGSLSTATGAEDEDEDAPVVMKQPAVVDEVQRLIEETAMRGSVALDLNKSNLKVVPRQLLALSHLQYLYMEGNAICSLPEDFFNCFPCLTWLDLRGNQLSALPSAFIGRHQNLRTLLVEGNQLHTLPLELGLVASLNGLNIANNPLDFPPEEVIAHGTQIILAFLREVLKAKNKGTLHSVPRVEDLKIGDADAGSRQSSSGKLSSVSSPVLPPGNNNNNGLLQNSSLGSQERADLQGPVPQSVALHNKLTAQLTSSQSSIGRSKASSSSSSMTSKKTKKKKRQVEVSCYPEPPNVDRVEKQFHVDRRLQRLKEVKEKQDEVIQRRKDQSQLKDWQDEAKGLQQRKYTEKRIKGKIDYEEPATQAPFGVDEADLKMITNKERIAQGIKEKHEKIRHTLTPRTLEQMEKARAVCDQELQKRLKAHTTSMKDRRIEPKGTPQQEMAAAKHELEIAGALHKELEQRRKALEYRFTAFTGDIV